MILSIGKVLLVLSNRVLQHSQVNTEKENRKVSMLAFPNGPDHTMIACYLELNEEGEVEHINGVWPNSKHL